MDHIRWLKLKVIFPINSGFTDEQINEIESIRLKNEGIVSDFEIELGYFNIGNDNICQLNPKCFIPNGKTNKKYYTEVIFTSGNTIYALGKPVDVYDQLNQYYLEIGDAVKDKDKTIEE